jgi:hypothetical protein
VIIIETTTRERLVLVPEKQIVCTTHTRDATPEDLARGGFVLREQAAPGTLAHLRADLRDMTARAERAERERDAQIARADDAEASLARVLGARWAAEAERDTLLAELADAKAECQGAMLSAYAQYAETVRERDEARSEVARLTAPAEGEPTDEALRDAFEVAYRDAASECHANAIRAIYRLGVAHERARQQPAQDRATDEELYGLFNSTTMAFPVRAGVLAVAARVRQERCLIAQAVDAHMSTHVYRRGPDDWAVALGPRFVECEPADVPATLARLLGEVERG